jgi:uncharacterized HAD superfamily protein
VPDSAPPDAAKLDIVVIDIDGVLADVRHRLHYLSSQPKDWASFFATARDDAPLEAGIKLAALAANDHRIVYLTGRPERIRRDTAQWLRANRLPAGDLLMRRDVDRRPARVMKVEKLRELARQHSIALVVDDDIAVVQAVRRAGFPVQLADWMPTEPARDEPAGLFEIEELQHAQEDLGRT